MTTPRSSPTASARVAPWRDARLLGIATQIVVAVVVVAVVAILATDLASNMAQRRLSFDLDFLRHTAGFEIGESVIPYAPTDSYGQAILIGALNTLVVSVVGIVLATALGLVVGIARMSGNLLVNRLASGYVELFRNTPLLVQLFVIYFAVFLRLPPVARSLSLPGPMYLNQRGVFVPRPIPTETFPTFLVALAVGIVGAAVIWWLGSRRAAAGTPIRGIGWLGLAVLVLVPLGAWLASSVNPLVLDEPVVGRFNLRGGLSLSSEFSALVLGLVLYTAAFIAEVVRGGIQSVPHGQLEAARAIGLSDGQVLRLVVLPQALRVIIPPLTSQYLNLAKNSSLAIAIGYPDLFNVSTTVANQTGQPVAIITLVMGIYLAVSLVTSMIMNLYNRRVQIRER